MTNENAVKGMSIKKKALIVLCALVSVVVIVATSVLATVAYLTGTAAVSNVFTVGNVFITMDESKVKPDGTYLSGPSERGDTNTYNLVPGGEYIKDPVIHVAAGSQRSYLFITIKNDISSLAVNDDANKPTIAKQLEKNGWAKLEHQDVGDVYVYVGNVDGAMDGSGNFASLGVNAFGTDTVNKVTFTNATATDAKDYKLFEKFWVDDSHKDLTLYASAKITINAFAIQDTGLKSVGDAWNAIVDTYNSYLNIKHLNGTPTSSTDDPAEGGNTAGGTTEGDASQGEGA